MEKFRIVDIFERDNKICLALESVSCNRKTTPTLGLEV